MQEHFNSEYLHSDKFAKATFKGKLQWPIAVTKDETYSMTVTGHLNVHGVTQKRPISGILSEKCRN